MLLHLVKKIGWVKRKVCMSIGVQNAMELNNRGYSKFNLGPTQKTQNCQKREAWLLHLVEKDLAAGEKDVDEQVAVHKHPAVAGCLSLRHLPGLPASS